MGSLEFSVNVNGRLLTAAVEIGAVAAIDTLPGITAFEAVGAIAFRGRTYQTPVQLQISDNFSVSEGSAPVDAISVGFQIDGVVALLGQVSTGNTALLGSEPVAVSLSDFDSQGTVGVFEEGTLTSVDTVFSSFAVSTDSAGPVIVAPSDEADLFEGTPDADVFDGGLGNDTLIGLGGRDTLDGGAGRDDISGGGGADSLSGNGGKDTLNGDGGSDILSGGGGRDQLFGGGGKDELFGNGGRDELSGDNGRDMLFGGGGRDILSGGKGRDMLKGDGGRDRLDGGGGRDTLEGNGGRDLLAGGGGRDVFVFGSGDGVDTIADFATGQDRIDLQAFDLSFGALQIGTTDGNAVIGVGNISIMLSDVDGDELQVGDFLF